MMYEGPIREMRETARRLAALADDLPQGMKKALDYHGSRIVRDAKILTPVDTGLLMNSIRPYVLQSGDTTALVVGSRMVYAHYQHETPLNHKKRSARSKFIEIPFYEELDPLVDHIKRIIEEAIE